MEVTSQSEHDTQRHKYPFTYNQYQAPRNIHSSNDVASLQQRVLELQAELDGLDKEHEQMSREQELLQQESDKIKQHNKQLFESVTQNEFQG
jgi:cell division protein FtsB